MPTMLSLWGPQRGPWGCTQPVCYELAWTQLSPRLLCSPGPQNQGLSAQLIVCSVCKINQRRGGWRKNRTVNPRAPPVPSSSPSPPVLTPVGVASTRTVLGASDGQCYGGPVMWTLLRVPDAYSAGGPVIGSVVGVL